MNRPWLSICAALGIVATRAVGAERSTLDLIGRWDGVFDRGQSNFKMSLKVVADDDNRRVKVTLDNPERGMQEIPVEALLYNPPNVRIEIDTFRRAFTGKLSDDGESIVGDLEEAPGGGQPINVVFRKNTKAEKMERATSYTLAPGEAPDPRGYWLGDVEMLPDVPMRIGVRIGRHPDGVFAAQLDSFCQGIRGIPTSSIDATKGVITLNWETLQATARGKLSEDNRWLNLEWTQSAHSTPVRFSRQEKPATMFPENTSFQPAGGVTTDVRGLWSGVLDTPGGKLRLNMRFGRVPGEALTGALSSPDQGGTELLMNRVTLTNRTLLAEAKGIRGSFSGTLKDNGTEIDGTWEQGINIPLLLKRENPTVQTQK